MSAFMDMITYQMDEETLALVHSREPMVSHCCRVGAQVIFENPPSSHYEDNTYRWVRCTKCRQACQAREP